MPILDSIDCYSSSDVLFLFPRGSSLPPRQLWGNSETLKEQSPYFNTLLSSGFEESAATFPVAPFQPSLYDVKRKRQALQDGNDLRKALADSRANAEANGGNGKEVAQTSKEQGASTMEFVEEFESEEEDDLYHLDDSDDEDAEANLGPNRVPKPIHRIVIRDTPFKTCAPRSSQSSSHSADILCTLPLYRRPCLTLLPRHSANHLRHPLLRPSHFRFDLRRSANFRLRLTQHLRLHLPSPRLPKINLQTLPPARIPLTPKARSRELLLPIRSIKRRR